MIVRKLGFGSLLHISCDCILDDLFEWLGMQFNTTSCRIELRNGFKFDFNESIVDKILGIPCGGFPIQTKPTKQTVDFMNTFLGTTKPTTEHLLSMLYENISEEAFSRIFLLLVLSILIAPSSKGVPSKKYYNALVNIESVPKYNWCLFTLAFLVHEIKKCRQVLEIRGQISQEGAKFC